MWYGEEAVLLNVGGEWVSWAVITCVMWFYINFYFLSAVKSRLYSASFS